MTSTSIAVPLILSGSDLLAMVDQEDLFECQRYDWRPKVDKITGKIYARACFRVNGARVTLYLHRFIMGCRPGDGVLVDHINGDPLDCTRSNMRIATHSQNSANRRTQGIVRYKGVMKSGRKFRAKIEVRGERKELGAYHDPESAARAYDTAARKYFGEFAVLNFPGASEKRVEDPGYTVDPEEDQKDGD